MLKKINKKILVKEKLTGSLGGFLYFVRSQGIVGLSIGFILGGSVSKVVNSFVNDIVDPLLGLILGSVSGLQGAYVTFFGSKIRFGNFISVLIDFTVVAAICYFLVKGLNLDKIDKRKQ